MSKNTSKPSLPRKRAKHTVENPQYAAFARRILAAYARRVAAGDVEALRSMADLRSEVDTVIRAAVVGLREFGYSWPDIAVRLGVTRQAVQMRYGDPAERGALDRRLLNAGLGVSVATLAEVFADHHPGIPASATCPGCGYRYPDGVSDCPTNAAVRPMLYRRRAEDGQALSRLTNPQYADLHDHKALRRCEQMVRRSARPASQRDRDAQPLFDLTPGGGA